MQLLFYIFVSVIRERLFNKFKEKDIMLKEREKTKVNLKICIVMFKSITFLKKLYMNCISASRFLCIRFIIIIICLLAGDCRNHYHKVAAYFMMSENTFIRTCVSTLFFLFIIFENCLSVFHIIFSVACVSGTNLW